MSSAADRTAAERRQRGVSQAFRTGLIARFVSIVAGFATVPMALSSLGTEGFGVWSAITSSISMMAFLDFGIGNGAMGRITEALARNDLTTVRSVLRHAYTLLCGIALIVVVATVGVWHSGVLEALAVRSGSFLQSHLDLAAAFVCCYALVIPTSFVQRLLFAYQRAGDAALLQLVFSCLYLAAVVVGWHLRLGLSFFVLIYIAIMCTVYGAGTAAFLFKIAPRGVLATPFRVEVASGLLRDAGLFFILQMTVAAVYNSDQLVLSAFSEPTDVAVYATTAKLFSIVILVNGLMLGPMWPAYIDAKSRGDTDWIRLAYVRMLRRSIALSVVIAAALAAVGPPLISLWTGHRVQAPYLLCVCMAAWVILDGYGQCMAMLLNALRAIRIQLVIAIAFLVVGTGLKIRFCAEYGVYGAVVATAISFIVVVAAYETYFISKTLARINE